MHMNLACEKSVLGNEGIEMSTKEGLAAFRRWRLRLYEDAREAISDPITTGWDREIEALAATPESLLGLVVTTVFMLPTLVLAVYHTQLPVADNAMNFLLRDMLSSALLVLSLFALLLTLPTVRRMAQSMLGKVALFFVTTGILVWAKAQTAAVLAGIFPLPTSSLPWAMLLGTVYSTAGFVAFGLLCGAVVLEILMIGPLTWRPGAVRSKVKRFVIFMCWVLATLAMFTSSITMSRYLGDRGQFITALAAFTLDFRTNHKCDALKGELVAYLGDGVEKAVAVKAPNLLGISLYELKNIKLSDRLPKTAEFRPVVCNVVAK